MRFFSYILILAAPLVVLAQPINNLISEKTVPELLSDFRKNVIRDRPTLLALVAESLKRMTASVSTNPDFYLGHYNNQLEVLEAETLHAVLAELSSAKDISHNDAFVLLKFVEQLDIKYRTNYYWGALAQTVASAEDVKPYILRGNQIGGLITNDEAAAFLERNKAKNLGIAKRDPFISIYVERLMTKNAYQGTEVGMSYDDIASRYGFHSTVRAPFEKLIRYIASPTNARLLLPDFSIEEAQRLINEVTEALEKLPPETLREMQLEAQLKAATLSREFYLGKELNMLSSKAHETRKANIWYDILTLGPEPTFGMITRSSQNGVSRSFGIHYRFGYMNFLVGNGEGLNSSRPNERPRPGDFVVQTAKDIAGAKFELKRLKAKHEPTKTCGSVVRSILVNFGI